MGIVRAALRMLPRLDAEEALAGASCIGVAIGSGDERQRQIARWERQAAGPLLAPAKAAPRPLPNMGLGLKLVPARG